MKSINRPPKTRTGPKPKARHKAVKHAASVSSVMIRRQQLYSFQRKPLAREIAAILLSGALSVAPLSLSANTRDLVFVNPDELDGIAGGSVLHPALVDIDGDGDLDAFVGNNGGTVRFYLNTGTPASSQFSEQTGVANPFDGVDVGNRSTPAFADIDGDGDLDAFLGENLGTVLYYVNTGTVNSPAFTPMPGAGNPLDGLDVGTKSSPAFADIDGDGDFDAFIGDQNGTTRFLENTGTLNSPTFTTPGIVNPAGLSDIGFYSKPEFTDIDNDGDYDAFIGEKDGNINYFENTGNANTPAFSLVVGTGNPLNGVDVGDDSAPTFADIDADGDLDAILGAQTGKLKLLTNQGDVNNPDLSGNNPLGAFPVNYSAYPDFVDIDGDGDFDAFVGEWYGGIRFFENSGNNNTPSFAEITGASNPFNGEDVGTYSAPVFVDIDEDNDFDAFVGASDGTTHFYENTGNSNAPVFTEQLGAANPFNGVDVGNKSAPVFTDIDADGDFDAFIGESGGSILYFENTGSSTVPAFSPVVGAGNPLDGVTESNVSPAFADIDGDGDQDVFLGGVSGRVRTFDNVGDAANPSFTEQTGADNPLDGKDVGFFSVPTFVDIDGDGDLDAFVGEYYGAIDFFANETLADLSISQTDSPDPVLVGANITHTLTVTNNGPNDARSILVTDNLPGGVSFVSATPDDGSSCTESGGVVSCGLNDITNGDSVNIALVVTTNSSGLISNSANVSGNDVDPDTANNIALESTTVDPVVDLAITQTDAPDPVTEGENITYTFTISNSGPDSASGVAFSNTLPASVNFVSAAPDDGSSCTESGGTVTCSLNGIANGDSTDISVVVATTQDGSINNTASIFANEADQNLANNMSTESTNVNPAADLSMTQTVTGPLSVGSTATYTVQVTNNGPSDANGVVLTDTLPASAELISVTAQSGSCSELGGVITCNLGILAINASVDVTINIRTPQSGLITNAAAISATTADSNAANNLSSLGSIVMQKNKLNGTGAFGPATWLLGLLLAPLRFARYRFSRKDTGPLD